MSPTTSNSYTWFSSSVQMQRRKTIEAGYLVRPKWSGKLDTSKNGSSWPDHLLDDTG